MSRRFVKGSERMVDPITVGSIHFFQQFANLIPRKLQCRMLENMSTSTPHMGFVVEPYATFLFYEVADMQMAETLLPPGFRLAQTRAFEGDELACYAIVNVFRAHTSAFWGARAEFYLLAEDERTGLLSWVMVDYLSDTIGYDRGLGLRQPSAPGTVVTTTADGSVLVDLADHGDKRHVSFELPLRNGRMRPLDERLWIEGNLSVAYARQLSPHDAGVFSLTFPTAEMHEALDVPVQDLHMYDMSWYAKLLAPHPATVVCFPFAQHLVCDSPGASSGHANAEELERAAATLDFSAMPQLSIASAKRALTIGAAASLFLIVGLTVLLLLR